MIIVIKLKSSEKNMPRIPSSTPIKILMRQQSTGCDIKCLSSKLIYKPFQEFQILFQIFITSILCKSSTRYRNFLITFEIQHRNNSGNSNVLYLTGVRVRELAGTLLWDALLIDSVLKFTV